MTEVNTGQYAMAMQLQKQRDYDFACKLSPSLHAIPFNEVKMHFFILSHPDRLMIGATIPELTMGTMVAVLENVPATVKLLELR